MISLGSRFEKAIYYIASIIFNRLFRLFPLDQNKVLFLSDTRKNLSGNFAFVNRQIEILNKELSEDKKMRVFSSLRADRRVRRNLATWFKESWLIATSGVIFLDDFTYSTALIKVRKKQNLVQLWHGSGAFKKFAYSRSSNVDDIKHIHPGYKKYTEAIVSSSYCKKCFAEAFSIPEERVLATGIPRTDMFFNKELMDTKKTEFYSKYPELKEKKILLFAPTYRGSRVEDADYDFEKLDIESLYRALGDEWTILFKWHPALYNNISSGRVHIPDMTGFGDFVIDVSGYREVNDLMIVADALVTDYSSLIFDYALLDKPIIYFVYDIDLYQNGRGLYFPFDEYLYGPLTMDTESMIEAVLAGDLCLEKRDIFKKKFISSNDGRASERIVSKILCPKIQR